MILGFENGSVQVFCIDISVIGGNIAHFAKVQAIRPHKSSVVQLQWSQAPDNTLISVSTDRNVYIYQYTDNLHLEPLTFIPVDANVIAAVFAKQACPMVKHI